MALLKEEMLDSGVVIDYWKITGMKIRRDAQANVSLEGFLSKEAYDEGKTSLVQKRVQIPLVDLTRQVQNERGEVATETIPPDSAIIAAVDALFAAIEQNILDDESWDGATQI